MAKRATKAKAKPTRKKSPPKEPRALTPKQRLFAIEYLRDLNATEAAIRAGYSEKSAAMLGYQLLQIPIVREAIDTEMVDRAKRIKRDADGLLQRLWDEVDADIADLYDADGALKPVREWPMVWRKGLVAGMEIVTIAGAEPEEAGEMLEGQPHGGALKRSRKPEARIAKIKLSDRARRLELIGRHHGVQAWKDNVKTDIAEPLQKLAEAIAGKSIRPKDG